MTAKKHRIPVKISAALHTFISYNLGHNYLELCNVLVEIRLTTSKTKRGI